MKYISKTLYTLLLFFAVVSPSQAQDFTKVDNTVKQYPKFNDIDKLASQINADFKTDIDKARAIFTYIATTVKYDYAAYGVNQRPVAYSYRTEQEKLEKQKQFKEELAVKTLKSRKAVCQGYSTLYDILAAKTGLESVIITGTSKSHPAHIGKGPGASDHAWNAVKINGKWKLLDATWAAGVVTGAKPEFSFKFNDGYFFAEPDVFFLNHFPDDTKWLLTNKTANDFANLPLYYGNYLMGNYNFVSPVNGSFTNKAGAVIPFKITNLKPGDKVHYVFSKDKTFKEVFPKDGSTVAEFNVPLSASSTGTLTVYINLKSVAAYSIEK
jgi:hypothetical protein